MSSAFTAVPVPAFAAMPVRDSGCRRGCRSLAGIALILAAAVLAGCEGDMRSGGGGGDDVPDVTVATGEPGQAIGNGSFSLRTANRTVGLVEGGSTVAVGLTLTREAGYEGSVTLAAEAIGAGGAQNLFWSFGADTLSADQSTTELQISLAIGAAPLLPQERTLRVIATDGNNVPVVSDLVLQIQPTDLPDVYLLAGQSNMVGFSQPDARQAGAGQADAVDGRIVQLNVTGNDQSNFQSAQDFTDASIAAPSPVLPTAIDPLHDGYDVDLGGKAGGFIGPGLSFAKAALTNTTADIVLVPAAWSDTGFCRRETNLLPGQGWLPQPNADAAYAGTLLHDRAVARANLALQQSGGVLRGILWHQGEADSDNVTCASGYAENLRNLAASLRSNIQQDARGAGARGPTADIPFIVGTMSKGNDARGDMQPFGPAKQLVDSAHRGVGESIPFAAFSNNDDLVPAAYPCGEGSCIHFGAAAQREMGARYYALLATIVAGR